MKVLTGKYESLERKKIRKSRVIFVMRKTLGALSEDMIG
jgi:hypothetical protein